MLLAMPLAVLAAPAPLVCEDTDKNKFIAKTFSCTQHPGITYRLTECVKEILQNTASTGFDKILKDMSKAVGAVLTMFVALTGMKLVLGGVRNMKAEAVTTLLKLACVAAFALNTGAIAGKSGLQEIYDLVQGLNSGLVDTVSGTLVSSGPCSTDAAGDVEKNVWKRVDCTIFAFIGRSTPTYVDKLDENGNVMLDKNNNPIQTAKVVIGKKDPKCDGNLVDAPVDDITLFEFGLSQLFTPHGVFVLFLLGAAALMMLISFGRALNIYVISFVAITFLMLLAPIFIPMILFARTRQMFLTWLAMIIGYVIQPAMLMAFLVFLLASINVALYGDPTTGTPGFKDSLDKMNEAMEVNQCTVKVLGCAQNAIEGKGADKVIEELECMKRKLGEEVNNITAPVTPIPYKDLAVFIVHLIACVVLLYVMMALMTNVADFVASLSAGAGSNLGRFGGGMQQLAGAAKDAISSASK